jgi:hypothetical protein
MEKSFERLTPDGLEVDLIRHLYLNVELVRDPALVDVELLKLQQKI